MGHGHKATEMSTQPDLFNPSPAATQERARARAVLQRRASRVAEAEQAKADAIAAAERGAGSAWARAAATAIRRTAERMAEFTTDALWINGLPQPREPRALGAAMKRAAKAGVIAATDRYEMSTRTECHRRPVRVWRSLIRKA